MCCRDCVVVLDSPDDEAEPAAEAAEELYPTEGVCVDDALRTPKCCCILALKDTPPASLPPAAEQRGLLVCWLWFVKGRVGCDGDGWL